MGTLQDHLLPLFRHEVDAHDKEQIASEVVTENTEGLYSSGLLHTEWPSGES